MLKIYVADLSFPYTDLYRPYFSKYRMGRLEKIKDPQHFAQAEVTEALLCHAAKNMGLSLPLDIKILPHGKPYADNLNFSLSHSGERALVAISDKEVGADIQKINPNQNLAVARKFLTEKEMENIDVDEFFRLFTIKESYFKMTGEGLPLTPKAYSSFEKCYFKTIKKDGYVISVCSKEGMPADIIYV